MMDQIAMPVTGHGWQDLPAMPSTIPAASQDAIAPSGKFIMLSTWNLTSGVNLCRSKAENRQVFTSLVYASYTTATPDSPDSATKTLHIITSTGYQANKNQTSLTLETRLSITGSWFPASKLKQTVLVSVPEFNGSFPEIPAQTIAKLENLQP